jgi:hypothetical protein
MAKPGRRRARMRENLHDLNIFKLWVRLASLRKGAYHPKSKLLAVNRLLIASKDGLTQM